MTPDSIKSVLWNWPWLVIAVAIVWPVVHFLYSHRMDALKEDVDRLRNRIEDMKAAPPQSSKSLVAISSLHAATDVAPLQQSASATQSPAAQRPVAHDRDGASEDSEVWEYSSFMKLPPRAPAPSERVFLGKHGIKEIAAAYKALPPLERETGIKQAYGRSWIRGNGKVTRVYLGFETYVVLVVTEDNFWVGLSYPLNQRPKISGLREGQAVTFEGLVRSADHTSVDLVYPQVVSAPGAA